MSQVIIVSNRLPISIKKVKGKLKIVPSTGGLATGLASYTKDKKNTWVGWPGIVSEELSEDDKDTISKKLARHNCYPVFLSRKQFEGFYNGYSNSVLWPLFHEMSVRVKNQDKLWASYRQVNELYAEVVMGLSTAESTIWVHDYQLLLVPEMLRAEHPYDVIGFFLHVPFPGTKILKKVPQAKSLLKGMLGSDLIGFHTDSYVQNFLESCRSLHVGKPDLDQVILGDRTVRVTAFPLGIDYSKFSEAGSSRAVKKHVKKHKKRFGKRRKIILTVDRLDPTKGLAERLSAYQELLQNNRRLHKKVVMVMLAIPSRQEIEAYRRLKTKVEQLVFDINLTFGRRKWQPVHYIYGTVPFEELAALYRVADVAFIAPIKDGMNLVAKEYVASRPDKHGVLILSETAGAAQELTEALLVNPERQATLTDALSKSLSMRPRELRMRLKHMKQKLSSNTVNHWKQAFMSSLKSSRLNPDQRTRSLGGKALERMLKKFVEAKNPTILLDYDGVLTSFTDKPSAAKPSKATLDLLKKLTARMPGGVLLISGRNKYDLESWLGDLPLTLAAEHGALLRSAKGAWRTVVDTPSTWKRAILPVLEKYADKTPGAFVEEKECSLVWHFRKASPFYAQKNIAILKRTLNPLLKSLGLVLHRGNMILEVKSPGANKGVAAKNWVKKKHDFILALGDDYTDEDTFAALPDKAYTIKVGRGKTAARFRLNSVDEVHKLLDMLVKTK